MVCHPPDALWIESKTIDHVVTNEMNILVVGLNHKTATVEIREKVAFDGPKLGEALTILKETAGVRECIVLSTCNRVEIYAGVPDREKGIENIKGFIAAFHDVPRGPLDQALYIYEGHDAVKHVFRVASSLDSMVVGEPQILGQLKDAFEFALKNKSTGVYLNKLMKKAVSVAKRVRTETRIAESAVSISFAAVELAKKIFEDLSTKSFMLIGAGEMAELAARHLINSGVQDVLVTNRTHERAVELAREFEGRVVPFENFVDELTHIDIVIGSTGAPTYILHKDQVQRIMKERRQQPMFIIDISVPRNIDPEINNLDNVYLYDVDDLQGVVDTNIKERSKEAEKAERLVESEVHSFLKWQESLIAVPTIVAIREKAEAVRKEELEKTLRKLGPIEEAKIKAIEQLSNSIVNKLIHAPTAALKSEHDDRDVMVDMAKRLFGIETEEKNEKE
jgi:glutamyl-tRNA reductase